MTSESPRLVRTPAQHPGESPLGFVLRVSELNGYATPRHVFEMADIPRREMFTLWLNVEKLAKVLGRESSELHGYEARGQSGSARVELCGHRLTTDDFRLTQPKICPQCIHEHGYVPAWTDLGLVDACPFHRVRLLTDCPKCGHDLSWFRPGLLTCRCGADLTDVRGSPITEEHTALLEHVVAKLTGVQVAGTSGFPSPQLETMSLARLIAMARSLALLHVAATKESHPSEAERAARMFSRWPNNLHSALRNLAPSSSSSSAAVQMRQQAEGVYRTWLKNVREASDIAFLREALGSVSEPLDSAESLSIPTSRADPAAAAPDIERKRKSRATNIERRSWRVTEPGQRSFGGRDAARRLQMPVSVLTSLRQSGHFEVRHKASRVAAFHEADIVAFEAKLAALQPVASGDSVGRSVRWVFAQKFKYAEGKGEFVAAVLEGVIQILGKEGTGIRGLLLDREQSETFIAQARAKAFAGAMTPAAVAKELQCCSMAVLALAAEGHLQGHDCAAGLRLSPASVADFKSRYRSLAGMARERGTSSPRLLRRVHTAKIALLNASRGEGRHPQPFIRVEDVELLNCR